MIQKSLENIAVFAGTFNPFTIGHADIVKRGLQFFDKIVICIGVNFNKVDETNNVNARLTQIRDLYQDEPRVRVEKWSGLTADFAKKNAAHFLLRGVRSVKDYEYERDIADANKAIFGLETVILFSDPSFAYVSSSLVRELEAYGQDVSHFLPEQSSKRNS